MPRLVLAAFFVLIFAGFACAEDSLQVTAPVTKTADTIFVIPAGPVAGAFTPESRVTVADTVAGWARIYVEGWVPVGAVLNRLDKQTTFSPDAGPLTKVSTKKPKPPARQCEAITRKGSQCTRNATPGSPYCWQHQKR